MKTSKTMLILTLSCLLVLCPLADPVSADQQDDPEQAQPETAGSTADAPVWLTEDAPDEGDVQDQPCE